MSAESPKPPHLRPPSPSHVTKSNRSRSKEKDFDESPQIGPQTHSDHPVKVTIFEEPDHPPVELRTPSRSPTFRDQSTDESPFSTPRTLLSLSAPTTPSSDVFLSEVTPRNFPGKREQTEEYDDEHTEFSGVKSEGFNNEERAALIAAVARHPDQNWHAILNDPLFSSALSNRTMQQCKEEFEAMQETVRELSAVKAEKDRAGKTKQEEESSTTEDDETHDPSFVIRIPRNRITTPVHDEGAAGLAEKPIPEADHPAPKKRGRRKRVAAVQEPSSSKRQKNTRGGRSKRESRRRLPWSDVELIALKAGVAQYGRDWNAIKNDATFGPLLVNRTQIAMRKQLTFGRAMKAFERQAGESTGTPSSSITHSADLVWSGEESDTSNSKSEYSSSGSSSESEPETSQSPQRLETLPEEASPSDRPSETDNSPPAPATPRSKSSKGRHSSGGSHGSQGKRSSSHESKYKRSHASPSSAVAAASLLRLDSAPKLSLGSSNREHPSSHDNSQANLLLQSYILLRDQLNVMSQANMALQNENMALSRRVMALENSPLMYAAMNNPSMNAMSFDEQKSQNANDQQNQQRMSNKFSQPALPTHHMHPSFVPTTTQVHSTGHGMLWNPPPPSFGGASYPALSPTNMSPLQSQAQQIQQQSASSLLSSHSPSMNMSHMQQQQQSFPSLNLATPHSSPSMSNDSMLSYQYLVQQQRQQQLQQQLNQQQQQQQQQQQSSTPQQSPSLQPTAIQRTFQSGSSSSSDGSQRADIPRASVSRHVTM